MRDQPEHTSRALLIQWALVCAAIVALNFALDLKDREIYRLYHESLASCEGLACLLISDDLRSPVFLGLVIGAQRLGIGVDALFAGLGVACVTILTLALRGSPYGHASPRFLLITLALGTWIYLIQVKLLVAVALFLLGLTRKGTAGRVLWMVAAVLTHESVLLLLALQLLWQPGVLQVNKRFMAMAALVLLPLVVYGGAMTNILETGVERLAHYNALLAQGEVQSISRVSVVSILLGAFALAGAVLNVFQRFPLKAFLWLSLPWWTFLALAGNEVFALRISALALLHALLVVPLGSRVDMLPRALMTTVALAFGVVVFAKDVVAA